MTVIEQIQTALGVKADNAWGPISQAAFDALIHPELIPASPAVHLVKATSFADPADLREFERCKAEGMSDEEAFRYGDNGIGRWGDQCSTLEELYCALPPEDWESLQSPHLALVEVKANGKTAVAKLADTMPHKNDITNGAGLDMNPGLCAALGLTPPVMATATWEFVS